MIPFLSWLLQECCEEVKGMMEEWQKIAKAVLQVAMDESNTAAHSMATAVTLCWASWLQVSGIPKEVQVTIADLLFQGMEFT